MEFGIKAGCTGGGVDIGGDVISVFAALDFGLVEIELSIFIAEVGEESISGKCAEDWVTNFELVATNLKVLQVNR